MDHSMVPMQIHVGNDDDDDAPKSHAAIGLGNGRKSNPIATQKIQITANILKYNIPGRRGMK